MQTNYLKKIIKNHLIYYAVAILFVKLSANLVNTLI